MWNKRELKDRGWTETMISRLLGEPDHTEDWHLRWIGWTTVCFFKVERVEAVEQTEAWQKWRAKNERHAAARAAGAMQAAETRRINEVCDNPNARHALTPYLNTRHAYEAVFEGQGQHGWLLRDVSVGDVVVADHVWVSTTDWAFSDSPSLGSRVHFTAVAEVYRKGYMGHRPDRLRGTTCDIKLTAVRPASSEEATQPAERVA